MFQRKRLMGRMALIGLSLLLMVFTGCGGSGSTSTPPAKPTGMTATAGSSQAVVSWPAVSGATSYNIYYGTTAGVSTTNGSKMVNASTPQVMTGLTDGTAYYFVVTAMNATGESVLSDEVSVTPLAKPAGIGASGGDSKVTVSWSAVNGATSYNIYYGTTAGVSTSTGTKVANVTTPQVIAGLTNGTAYYFVVTAVNAGGESSVSSEKSATPSVAPQPPASPTGRVVTSPSAGQINVTWNAVSGAISYNVYYLQASPAPTKIAVLASTPASSATNSISLAGLNSGATYYVLITAVNAAGESGTQTNAQAITVL